MERVVIYMELALALTTFGGAALALIFAYVVAKRVLGFSEGDEKMQKIAGL